MLLLFLTFLTVIIGAAAYLVRLKWLKQAEARKHLQAKLQASVDDVRLLSQAWKVEWSEIEIGSELASGSFGAVHRGIFQGKWDVAIKRIFKSQGQKFDDDAEIRFLTKARHPRLVMFLGCGYQPDGNLFMVLEFCDRGGLDKFLWHDAESDSSESHPPWAQRLVILGDVVEGMTHLHCVLNSIHRDLKSPNILLVSDNRRSQKVGLRAKVADFGLSKILKSTEESRSDHDAASKSASPKKCKGPSLLTRLKLGKKADTSSDAHEVAKTNSDEDDLTIPLHESTTYDSHIEASMTRAQGSILWMAPEICVTVGGANKEAATYSQAVDVYSFGIIMWETLMLRPPWSHEKRFKFITQVLFEVEGGKRPPIKESISCPAGYVNLMRKCWHQDSHARPPFSKIRPAIDDLKVAIFKEAEIASRVRKGTPLSARSLESELASIRIRGDVAREE